MASVGTTFPPFFISGTSASTGAPPSSRGIGLNADLQEVLERRDDLKMVDLTVQDGSRPHPILNDPDSRAALLKSRNLTPRSLYEMQQQMQRAVADPSASRSAYKMGLDVLTSGQDAEPPALGKLFGGLMEALGGKPESAPLALDMFGNAREALKSGRSPEDLLRLARTAGQVGGKSGRNVARAFQKAVSSRQSPDQVARLAQALVHNLPGPDSSERVRAFDSGLQLLHRHPSLASSRSAEMVARSAAPKEAKLLEVQRLALHAGHLTLPARAEMPRFPPAPNLGKMARLPNLFGRVRPDGSPAPRLLTGR